MDGHKHSSPQLAWLHQQQQQQHALCGYWPTSPNWIHKALACLIVGKEYLLLRRKMTQVIKDNPHIFPFNFEANKEQHRKRVTEQVRFLVKNGHLNLSLLRLLLLSTSTFCPINSLTLYILPLDFLNLISVITEMTLWPTMSRVRHWICMMHLSPSKRVFIFSCLEELCLILEPNATLTSSSMP